VPDLAITARDLILALIDSTAVKTLTAGYFIAAGGLFKIESSTVRVALARLVKDDSLIQVERGVYSLGSRGGELHSMVRNWSSVERGLKPWKGGWIVAFLGHLKRTNKSQVRARERALRLLGLAATDFGLWLRPDNFSEPLTTTRSRLVQLGLDETAMLARIAELQPPQAIDPQHLWRTRTLEATYREHLAQLKASTRRLKSMNDASAARETLLLGRSVTRQILLDPLLPEEMVDQKMRGAMIDAMRGYDRLGRKFWGEFYKANHDE